MNEDIKYEFNRISKLISGTFMIQMAFITMISLKIFNIQYTIFFQVILWSLLILGCYSYFMNTTTMEQSIKGIKISNTGIIKNGKTDKRTD